MKKPEINDYKREIWDGSDMADWYQDYYKALEKYIEYLESKIEKLSLKTEICQTKKF